MILILVFVSFVHGINHIIDKFFNLYVVTFIIIVQPAFYLTGDIEFRTNVANNGYLNAIKKVLF